MKRLLFMSISIFVFISFGRAHSLYEDASQILKTVLAKQNRINDYQVNIEIELDVDFINMPVKHAVMYYKHPQKIKFKSDEFIMLPQKGLNFSLRKILKKKFTSIFTGYEYIDQRRHYISWSYRQKSIQILFFRQSGWIPNYLLFQKWRIIPGQKEATPLTLPTEPKATFCLRR